MRLRWAPQPIDAIANGVGYANLIQAFAAALPRAGVTFDDDAPLVLHVGCPPRLPRVHDRVNVLLTMWECRPAPPLFTRLFDQVEAIITPSTFCRDVFRPLTRKPIHVVPLGVDVNTFRFVGRMPPSRPFRWLWVGAPNPRKGIQELVDCWHRHFAHRADCELYLKTTNTPETIEHHGNVTIDSRRLATADLAALFGRADGFVTVPWGEGWNLPLLEAMATGLPCVVTRHTGMRDYTDATTVRPVRFRGVTAPVQPDPRSPARLSAFFVVDVDALADEMRAVMADWPRAHAMGLRAHFRARNFTWDRAARRLVAALNEIAARAGIKEERHGAISGA